jgi:hypothetical protein
MSLTQQYSLLIFHHPPTQALKAHDRVEAVAHWGCNVVYVLSCWSPELRDLLGNAKVRSAQCGWG